MIQQICSYSFQALQKLFEFLSGCSCAAVSEARRIDNGITLRHQQMVRKNSKHPNNHLERRTRDIPTMPIRFQKKHELSRPHRLPHTETTYPTTSTEP